MPLTPLSYRSTSPKEAILSITTGVNTYLKVDGVWKRAKSIYHNQGGTWVSAVSAWYIASGGIPKGVFARDIQISVTPSAAVETRTLSGQRSHFIKSTCTITVNEAPSGSSIEVAVIGGGGGGGNSSGTGPGGGGGGGAGGFNYINSYPVYDGDTFSVIIGAGGGATARGNGSVFYHTVFATTTAYAVSAFGGGYGGDTFRFGPPSNFSIGSFGGNGASGGGGPWIYKTNPGIAESYFGGIKMGNDGTSDDTSIIYDPYGRGGGGAGATGFGADFGIGLSTALIGGSGTLTNMRLISAYEFFAGGGWGGTSQYTVIDAYKVLYNGSPNAAQMLAWQAGTQYIYKTIVASLPLSAWSGGAGGMITSGNGEANRGQGGGGAYASGAGGNGGSGSTLII